MMRFSRGAVLVAGGHAVWLGLAIPAAASAQTAPPAAAPASATDSDADRVWVHINGSDVAQLEQDTTGDHRHWQTVCSAPCDESVPSKYTYRITGDGIRNSRMFTLRAQNRGRETLNVDEGSKGDFVLGIVGASVGGFVMMIGFAVVLVNAASNAFTAADGASSQNEGNGETIGWITVGVGLASIVGGVILLAANARSDVSQTTVSTHAGVCLPIGSPALGASTGVSARWPVLGGGSHENLARDVPTMGVPLFGGRF